MFIDNWKMFYEGKELMCKAPCSMYSVLLDYNLIENPFWGLNEQSLTHLSDKNCTFIGEFLVDNSNFAHDL